VLGWGKGFRPNRPKTTLPANPTIPRKTLSAAKRAMTALGKGKTGRVAAPIIENRKRDRAGRIGNNLWRGPRASMIALEGGAGEGVPALRKLLGDPALNYDALHKLQYQNDQ
jgi:hypothetical protein